MAFLLGLRDYLRQFFGHHFDWTSERTLSRTCDTAQTWNLCHRYPSSSESKDTRFTSERQRELKVARSDIREIQKHHHVTVIITPAFDDSRKLPSPLLPSSTNPAYSPSSSPSRYPLSSTSASATSSSPSGALNNKTSPSIQSPI